MPSLCEIVCCGIKDFLSLTQVFFPSFLTFQCKAQQVFLIFSCFMVLCVFSCPSERCSGSDALVACSALKRLYRQILLYGSKALTSSSHPGQNILPPSSPDVFFLFLHGDYDLLKQRMVARKGHYMKADLLRSQFDVLEHPSDEENVLPLDIRRDIPDMVTDVERHLTSLGLSRAPLPPQQIQREVML